MVKLKRYLGLTLAIALLGMAFLPIEKEHHRVKTQEITPLDVTVLSALTGVGGHSSWFWRDYASQAADCAAVRAGRKAADRSCDRSDFLSLALSRSFSGDIVAEDRQIAQLIKEYREAQAADNPRIVAATTSLGRPQAIRSQRVLTAEAKLTEAVAGYVANERSALATSVYVVHGFAIVVFLLLVTFRERVGGLVLWPFSLLGGAAKAGGKAAKAIHEKV